MSATVRLDVDMNSVRIQQIADISCTVRGGGVELERGMVVDAQNTQNTQNTNHDVTGGGQCYLHSMYVYTYIV